MINKTRFWQADCTNPEEGVVDRLNEWRDEHPEAVILGVQWSCNPTVATCDVTFEVPDEPT